jgi:hypothetical protein
VEADREGDALPMQKQMTGTGVTVRYDPENPDVSILEDRRILGSEAYAEFALGAVGAKRLGGNLSRLSRTRIFFLALRGLRPGLNSLASHSGL